MSWMRMGIMFLNSKNRRIMKEKIKNFWNKHKGKIALGAVTLGTGLVAFKLYGKNREMAGQIENLNHQVNGLQKTN